MLWNKIIGAGGLSAPFEYRVEGIGGGLSNTLADIETSTGTLPVPGDVLLFHICSVTQSHSPVTGNPAVQLRRDVSGTLETEIWGCIVEEGQTTFAFNRGGSTTDDYGWSFLKRTAGPIPTTINVDSEGGGDVTSLNINYDNTANGLTFRVTSLRNQSSSSSPAYDDTDTQVTDSTLKQSRESGVLRHSVFVDETGGGRLTESQSTTFLSSYVVLSLS